MDCMSEKKSVVFRELRAEDLCAWLALRKACFGEGIGAGAALDEEAFQRLFTRNPAGVRIVVAVDGKELVASYGAQPMRVRLGEEEVSFSHVVDSMVHPERRVGLKNPGLFVRTARAFFERYGELDAVHFGWPVERALRVGRRFLEYRVVREELALVCELGDGGGRAGGELPRGVVELESVGPEVLELWERCAQDWEASTVRSAEFVRWRFLEHPRRSYAVLAVKESEGALAGGGRLAGMCVVGLDELQSAGAGEGARALVEWLVPAGSEQVARSLEAAARARAVAAGGTRLVASVPPWSGAFGEFQERGWRVVPTPYSLSARCFDRRVDLDLLGRGWWLTLADGDLA
jgi:hypothetical protein